MKALSVYVLGWRVLHVELELSGCQEAAQPQEEASPSEPAYQSATTGVFEHACQPEPAEFHVGFR